MIDKNLIIGGSEEGALLHDIPPGDCADNVSTVLVIESEPECRVLLREMLSKDFNVIVLPCFDEAVDSLRAHPDEVAAMLVDLTGYEKDGCDFIRMAKSTPELAVIPIIAVPKYDTEDGDLVAVRTGADYFIHKPYHRDIVLHYIKKSAETVKQTRQKSLLERENMRLSKSAYHDSLTGLFNRRGLSKAIERIGDGELYATVMIDIDNLKTCNDTFGHHCGDRLITTVARTLMESTRTTDILARIGGDEFVVILRRITDTAHAYDKVKSLCGTISRAVIPDSDSHPSCSAGITFVSGRGEFDMGLEKADAALYHAKRAMKGGCVIWGDINTASDDGE